MEKWQGCNNGEYLVWAMDTWEEFYQAVLDGTIGVWDENEPSSQNEP